MKLKGANLGSAEANMKKLLMVLLLGIAVTAHAGAGWSIQRLVDFRGSPTSVTVAHCVLGIYDYGLCDRYDWTVDDNRTAYVLRSDWNGWPAGTVCYEIALMNGGAVSQNIYYKAGLRLVWETEFFPPGPATGHLVVTEEMRRDQNAQKDLEALKKFKADTEKATATPTPKATKEQQAQKDIEALQK